MLHPKSVQNQTLTLLTLAQKQQRLAASGNTRFPAQVTPDFPQGVSVLSGSVNQTGA